MGWLPLKYLLKIMMGMEKSKERLDWLKTETILGGDAPKL